MQVWKITLEGMGGTLYLSSLDTFEGNNGPVEDHEVGSRFTMEVVEMDRETFLNLPEFECFE